MNHIEKGPNKPDSAEHLTSPDKHLLAEDLLLLLFDPRTGTIAGEGTLFYTLAGAVLTELALANHIEIDNQGWRGRVVHHVGDAAPEDPLLHAIWDDLAERPREVQGLLAEMGPALRGRVLDRLVEHGDIRREKGKVLGLFPTTSLHDGGTSRRADLLAQVRAVLVNEEDGPPRATALAALLWASGTLPTFHRDIPWNSSVITRARALERCDWGAQAVSEAIMRTTSAILTGTLIATGVNPAK